MGTVRQGQGEIKPFRTKTISSIQFAGGAKHLKVPLNQRLKAPIPALVIIVT